MVNNNFSLKPGGFQRLRRFPHGGGNIAREKDEVFSGKTQNSPHSLMCEINFKLHSERTRGSRRKSNLVLRSFCLPATRAYIIRLRLMYAFFAWIMREYSKGRGAQSPLLIPLRSHSWLLSGEFLAPALPDAAVARVVSAYG